MLGRSCWSAAHVAPNKRLSRCWGCFYLSWGSIPVFQSSTQCSVASVDQSLELDWMITCSTVEEGWPEAMNGPDACVPSLLVLQSAASVMPINRSEALANAIEQKDVSGGRILSVRRAASTRGSAPAFRVAICHGLRRR